ncbi:MAG: hypothetical protein MUO68_19005 [Desulfobacteraceae bacterium]|nr:hypothetical protein [Desulfobacteraceae bacterium]
MLLIWHGRNGSEGTNRLKRVVRIYCRKCGFSYFSIPLEIDAFELQRRYESDPSAHFPVADEASRRVDRS